MISNLGQSPDMDAADHNAFEKTPAQIEKQVDEYMKAANYGTTDVFGRSLNPMRDFHPQPLESNAAKIAEADLLLSAKQLQNAEREYTGLHGPDAAEGLGMIALAQSKKEEARRLLRARPMPGARARGYG